MARSFRFGDRVVVLRDDWGVFGVRGIVLAPNTDRSSAVEVLTGVGRLLVSAQELRREAA